VTPLDWIIVAFTALMAVWGFAQGLIVGALSLAGFAAGVVLGARFGPRLLEEGSSSPYAPLLALVCAVLLGGLFASSLELLGFRLRGRIGESLGVLDGLGGALLLGALGLGLVWITAAVALHTPGARELREPFQRSAIVRGLTDRLPPSSPLLRLLARFDPFPEIDGPAPNVGPPNSRIARDPDVRAAGRSIVRVLGTACGLGVQGSGWIAGNGLVVTNAHVVAGQDDTAVQLAGEGPRIDADAVFFDARNDLAVLRASGVTGAPALAINEAARPGTSGAILGFPENGSYDIEPGRLGQTTTIITQDAYGQGPVRRRITALRGEVRSGNSGGPMVDSQGRVVTTIFAATVADGGQNGFGVPNSIVRRGLARAGGPVNTGPCSR
jgi:hypothetical protein